MNHLSLQTAKSFVPHLIVQNKVPAQGVKQVLCELKSSFTPFSTSVTSLQLWEYLNSLWKLVEYFCY